MAARAKTLIIISRILKAFFDFDLVGIAGLLGNLLVRRGFVADVEQLGRVGSETKIILELDQFYHHHKLVYYKPHMFQIQIL